MGSNSDMPVMQEAAKFLDEMEIPFELNALSAHRTPEKVMELPWKKRMGKATLPPEGQLAICFCSSGTESCIQP